MAIMEYSKRKRPLHADHAPDLGIPGSNKLVRTVSSYLPSFEPIPTSDIGMEYQARRDRDEHHRAPSSHADGVDSAMPTADDYANLLFYESSDEDETNTTTSDATTVDEPAHVIVATEMTAHGGVIRDSSRRVSFAASVPTVHELIDVPMARDMTPDEVSNLWISRSDLEAYRSDAHSIAQDAKGRVLASERMHRRNAMLRSFMSTIERESDSSIRGLEKRLVRRLRFTRQEVTRDVLECQANVVGLQRFGLRGIGGMEMAMLLARVSRERSVNARKLAFVDAMEDRHDVLNDCK